MRCKRIATSIGVVTLTVLCPVLSAGKPLPDERAGVAFAADNCEAPGLTAGCIVSRAEQALTQLEGDPFAWSTAAVELAIALDALDESTRSEVLVAAAADRAAGIGEERQRVAAFGDIALALAVLRPLPDSEKILSRIADSVAGVEDVNRRADLAGKMIAASAVQLDLPEAFNRATALPEGEGSQASYKALALRKVAATFAGKGDFDTAGRVIEHITMGIDYYKSMARSDVAARAAGDDRYRAHANMLLDEAVIIARTIEDGYFRAGSLRDIAVAYHRLGAAERSAAYFDEAMSATADADTPNERARSMSRIATRMSDLGRLGATESVIAQSIAYAEAIESDVMRSFTDYEIAGAAAFCGHFDTAYALIAGMTDRAMGSTASVRSAAQRDLAWGLARHGQLQQAMQVVAGIESLRERIQAMSRIARVMNDPGMQALPRYL